MCVCVYGNRATAFVRSIGNEHLQSNKLRVSEFYHDEVWLNAISGCFFLSWAYCSVIKLSLEHSSSSRGELMQKEMYSFGHLAPTGQLSVSISHINVMYSKTRPQR